MSGLWIKALLSLAIFAAGWIGGRLPLAEARAPGANLMSWGNAFAAGIFLGTGLIHLLGESTAAWGELGWSYPMGLLLAAVGFMTLLLVEHVLMPQNAHAVVHAHSGEALPAGQIRRLSAGGSGYALLLALSMHSVLAGVALGAQGTLAGVLTIAVAIVAHKTSEAFALGISLAGSEVPKPRARTLILLFALATPAGILLGATLRELVHTLAGQYLDATFLALTGGTFIYIASIDILQDEFLHARGRFAKWLCAATGIALTAVLSVWL